MRLESAGCAATPPDASRRLRVLVCPHELVRGGSQINAIDVATTLRDRGHEVLVYAPPGPLSEVIASRNLSFTPAPRRRAGFAGPTQTLAAMGVLRSFRPDVVHTFEAPPTVVMAAVSLVVPHHNVITIMSMSVPDFLPATSAMFVGTEELVRSAPRRIAPVLLMEPPIDAEADTPGDSTTARAELGLSPDDFVVAVVGRLSHEHQKALGVADAIAELAANDTGGLVHLVVAGDGDAAELITAAAHDAKGSSNLEVHLLGDVPDPRGVYDAADVVFGMGSSALRGLAHRKPVIVQGLDGFWALVSEADVARFYGQGFFGSGCSGGPSLSELVGRLRGDERLRDELGDFGRRVVLDRYDLGAAVDHLEEAFHAELTEPLRTRTRRRAAAESLLRYGRFRLATSFPSAYNAYRRLAGRHV